MIYKQTKPNVFVYKVGINSLDTVSAECILLYMSYCYFKDYVCNYCMQ